MNEGQKSLPIKANALLVLRVLQLVIDPIKLKKKNRLIVFKQKVFGFPNKYFTKNTST